ncbi:glycosyltransferase [Cetobacterium sp.]|uniref:glycosyltransferase n=1 Tax=Cetobacterium sp. TaxID=2071632 RepID=UPI003EE562A1
MEKCSIVITVYNKYKELDLVLRSLENQSYKRFEVIIAEDCQKKEMLDFLKVAKNKYSFPIKHVSQEDIGFRKNRILNKAIKMTETNFIIFLDGDCLVHRNFIKNYMKEAKRYDVLYGRRVELSEALTNRILKENSDYRIRFLDLLLTKSENSWEAFYMPVWINLKNRRLRLLGSNMGVRKDVLYSVNGFNEEYTGAGIGEDSDLAWRLESCGVRHKCLKNTVVQYHLYHSRSTRHNSVDGEKIITREKMLNRWRTINGLEKI